MTARSHLSSIFQQALMPVLCLALIASFGWHALMGETGLLALGGYKSEQARLTKQAAEIAAERALLERRVELLAGPAEPDYAEELIRRRLNVVRDDEIIVRLPE